MCVAGLSCVAPGDGVSAAAAAVRTLHVAAQYIQHRKDREAPKQVLQEKLIHQAKHLDLLEHEPVRNDSYVHGQGQAPLQPIADRLRVSLTNLQDPTA